MAKSLSPTIQRYVNFTGSVDKKRKTYQIEELEKMIKNHKGQLSRVKRKFRNRVYREPDLENRHNYMYVKVVCDELKYTIFQIFDYESSNLRSIIDTCKELLDLVKSNSKVTVNIQDFSNDIQEYCRNNDKYHKLKWTKRTLSHKYSRLRTKHVLIDYTEAIKVELVAASQQFNEELLYAPPSQLDIVIAAYIRNAPWSQKMIDGIARFIAIGDPKVAIYTIGEFTNELYNKLGVTNFVSQTVLYNSVIRFVFNIAYPIKSELREGDDQNIIFLSKCELFAKQSVRNLRLCDDISRNYTPGLLVPSLFKSKQFNLLKPMEYMTNPLDLMAHVNIILDSLAQHFGQNGDFLSFDDTLTLLLGLTSLNPPANAVSIANFVNKWEEVQRADPIRLAKNFFVAAVDHLMHIDQFDISIPEEKKDFFTEDN